MLIQGKFIVKEQVLYCAKALIGDDIRQAAETNAQTIAQIGNQNK
jgi:hypothetical protein